eukprot:7895800-Alexandrium_andersonii.AAC.1
MAWVRGPPCSPGQSCIWRPSPPTCCGSRGLGYAVGHDELAELIVGAAGIERAGAWVAGGHGRQAYVPFDSPEDAVFRADVGEAIELGGIHPLRA